MSIKDKVFLTGFVSMGVFFYTLLINPFISGAVKESPTPILCIFVIIGVTVTDIVDHLAYKSKKNKQ